MNRKYIKFGLILSVLLFSKPVFTQNLVPNPGFETYEECPSLDNIGLIPLPWLSPPTHSIDYFNRCSDYKGVPVHGGNYQDTYTGNGYCALWGYNGINNNYREYLQVKLLDTLESNSCYYIEFYTNLNNNTKYAIKDIGLHLSPNQIDTTNTNYILDLDFHIRPANGQFITDTLNWIKISGIYTANGDEQYITIGNFNNDAETDTLNTGNGTYTGAYYYIDDISVMAVSDLQSSMPAYAGEDISITLGDSTFIGQEVYNLDCSWSVLGGAQIATGKSGLYVKPVQNTTYVVEQNLCGTITHDTVTVFVHALGVTPLGPPSKGESIVPNPNNGTFTVHAPGGISEAVLLDITGRELPVQIAKSGKDTYRVTEPLTRGMYTLVLTNSLNHGQTVHKIWVQ